MPTPGDPGYSGPRPHTHHLLLVVNRPQERAAHLLTVPVLQAVSGLHTGHLGRHQQGETCAGIGLLAVREGM